MARADKIWLVRVLAIGCLLLCAINLSILLVHNFHNQPHKQPQETQLVDIPEKNGDDALGRQGEDLIPSKSSNKNGLKRNNTTFATSRTPTGVFGKSVRNRRSR